MKQVVSKNPEPVEVVLVSDVDETKCYGVLFRNRGCRGFITRDGYRKGKFSIRCSTSGFTYGNRWSDFDSHSLTAVLSEVMKRNVEVCEFDTFRELALWLAEEAH